METTASRVELMNDDVKRNKDGREDNMSNRKTKTQVEQGKGFALVDKRMQHVTNI